MDEEYKDDNRANRSEEGGAGGQIERSEVGLEAKMGAVLTERYLSRVRQRSKVILFPVAYSGEVC